MITINENFEAIDIMVKLRPYDKLFNLSKGSPDNWSISTHHTSFGSGASEYKFEFRKSFQQSGRILFSFEVEFETKSHTVKEQEDTIIYLSRQFVLFDHYFRLDRGSLYDCFSVIDAVISTDLELRVATDRIKKTILLLNRIKKSIGRKRV